MLMFLSNTTSQTNTQDINCCRISVILVFCCSVLRQTTLGVTRYFDDCIPSMGAGGGGGGGGGGDPPERQCIKGKEPCVVRIHSQRTQQFSPLQS